LSFPDQPQSYMDNSLTAEGRKFTPLFWHYKAYWCILLLSTTFVWPCQVCGITPLPPQCCMWKTFPISSFQCTWQRYIHFILFRWKHLSFRNRVSRKEVMRTGWIAWSYNYIRKDTTILERWEHQLWNSSPFYLLATGLKFCELCQCLQKHLVFE
jgi:hypothetical protein